MIYAHSRWAATLFLAGRFSESFRQYEQTAELEQRFGDSVGVAAHPVALGFRYLTIGEADSAEATFHRAHKISPKDLMFSNFAFKIAIREGDLERTHMLRDTLL
jgi:hypothetical protein